MATFDSTLVSSLLARDLDDLLIEVGRSAAPGAMPGEPEEQRQFGRGVLVEWFRTIRSHVCGKKESLDDINKFLDLLAGPADAVLEAHGKPTVTVLAVTAYKYGLDKLCSQTE
jgi:hypothetical protein